MQVERYAYLHEVRNGFVTVSPYPAGQAEHAKRRHIPLTSEVTVFMVASDSRRCLLTLPEEFANLYGLNPSKEQIESRQAMSLREQYEHSKQYAAKTAAVGDSIIGEHPVDSSGSTERYTVIEFYADNGRPIEARHVDAQELQPLPAGARADRTKTTGFDSWSKAWSYVKKFNDYANSRAKDSVTAASLAGGGRDPSYDTNGDSSDRDILNTKRAPSAAAQSQSGILNRLSVPPLEDQLTKAAVELFQSGGFTDNH